MALGVIISGIMEDHDKGIEDLEKIDGIVVIGSEREEVSGQDLEAWDVGVVLWVYQVMVWEEEEDQEVTALAEEEWVGQEVEGVVEEDEDGEYLMANLQPRKSLTNRSIHIWRPQKVLWIKN